MMKVSIVQADLCVGQADSFAFFSSAEALDVNDHAYRIDGTVKVTGSVVHTGRCYRVEGKISFQKEFLCDRCLEASRKAEVLNFFEEYRKVSDDEAKDDAVSFSGDFIDIAELIRETILLAQPLHQLCSEDCCGLCLKCGANLNHGDCGCDRHIVDPRLAALQKLLHKND